MADGFPLFPLGIVALPGESVPLHIFEHRYKLMIERCLGGRRGSLESQFGILWLADEELKQVGCACEIERVIERLQDGRMNILARGTRPLRLLEREDAYAYPAGVVEFLVEAPEQPDADALAEAHELYGQLVFAATDRALAPRELEEMDAYQMAGTVEFEPEAKQQLLELRSENERLRLLSQMLRAAMERLELIERAEARARSNGKVRFT